MTPTLKEAIDMAAKIFSEGTADTPVINNKLDYQAFKAGADWGYEQGRAEMQAEVDREMRLLDKANADYLRLERELAETEKYRQVACSDLFKAREEVERLTAERDEWTKKYGDLRNTSGYELGRRGIQLTEDKLHEVMRERDQLRAELAKRGGASHKTEDVTQNRYTNLYNDLVEAQLNAAAETRKRGET